MRLQCHLQHVRNASLVNIVHCVAVSVPAIAIAHHNLLHCADWDDDNVLLIIKLHSE